MNTIHTHIDTHRHGELGPPVEKEADLTRAKRTERRRIPGIRAMMPRLQVGSF